MEVVRSHDDLTNAIPSWQSGRKRKEARHIRQERGMDDGRDWVMREYWILLFSLDLSAVTETQRLTTVHDHTIRPWRSPRAQIEASYASLQPP